MSKLKIEPVEYLTDKKIADLPVGTVFFYPGETDLFLRIDEMDGKETFMCVHLQTGELNLLKADDAVTPVRSAKLEVAY
jgi:hypothetical protein